MTTYRRTHSSRRVFLKQSGAVPAGLPLVSSGAIAVNTAPQKIHRGIVEGGFGCGFQWHESAMFKTDKNHGSRVNVWWKTDMLPEPLRHNSGHGGSHTFLTHEFIDALTHSRKPTVDIVEALAYTVPGIVAHESALRGGELLKIPQWV